jgi:methylthioribose-1-phosphate isomerase
MDLAYTPLRIVRGQAVVILDQTLLPHEERYLELRTVAELCESIRELRVRGAPLLGLSGACGMAIASTERGSSDEALGTAARELDQTRPTAADLGAAIRRALELALASPEDNRKRVLWDNAEQLLASRKEEDERIATFGAPLIEDGWSVLTHCNTGALATGGSGTALAVVRQSHAEGRLERCYATETRPLLQGARLTTWELQKLGIPGTLLPDTAAASLISSGKVQAVITGADRIAANGDTANKVGTYGLAAVAARHGIPFYVAAPMSTVDSACPDGASIPIEYRRTSEVGGFSGQRWAPEGTDAYNPAFDTTPAELIAAIITERGVFRPPYGFGVPANG